LQEGFSILNSESSNPEIPTAAQLDQARQKRWHQGGEALLTAENLRSWINAAGLVLFAPRPQVVAPAPSLVEAVLGGPSAEPILEQMGDARSLLARLVAEGVAVPLNLMGTHGTAGDTPDFVASAAAFSYVFTLRGDKVWKQPPATSGPTKVSNLAAATYEALTSSGPLSAYDLATHLGKEVTETACLRALNELWTQLRVIPVVQPEGRATLWELTSSRFVKQIKAGANAGQPKALSALTAMYLSQAMAASEDEITSFLSPLAPRSRIREVLHALLAARQLATVAVDGKTLLHVAGEAFSLAGDAAGAPAAEAAGEPGVETPAEEPGDVPRIQKYVPKPRKVGTGYLAKGKPAFKRTFERGDTRGRGEGARPHPPAGREERERRPFRKPTEGAAGPRFDRPWEEDRPKRKAAEGESGVPRKPRFDSTRPDRARFEGRPERKGPPAGRPQFRSGPRPERRESDRPDRRPRRNEQAGGDRRPRREGDFERRPRRAPESGGSSGNFPRRAEGRDRVSRPTSGRREGGYQEQGPAQERPQFRRFDAPRSARPRPERDRDATGLPGGFDRRPPRTGARPDRGAAGGPPRREGSSDRFSPRRPGSSEGRPASRPGSFAKPKFGGSGKFTKSSGSGKPFSKKPSGPRGAAGYKKPSGYKKPGSNFRPRRDDSA